MPERLAKHGIMMMEDLRGHGRVTRFNMVRIIAGIN